MDSAGNRAAALAAAGAASPAASSGEVSTTSTSAGGTPKEAGTGTDTGGRGKGGAVAGTAAGAGAGAGAGAAGAGAGAAKADPDELPRLPLPELAETAEWFKATASPLLSETERAEMLREVQELVAEGGSGERLHELLKARRNDKSVENWLEQFWFDSYLRHRGPLPGGVSPFFVLEDDPTPSRNSQSARATSLILSTLKFYLVVKKEQLTKDQFRTVPLCMSQYKSLFQSTRLPGLVMDTNRQYPESQHIVVLSRGQFYWFNVLTPSGELCLKPDAIAANLRNIRDDSCLSSSESNAASAVGVLTSERRDTWARVRAGLEAESEMNKRALFCIDSALFVVCLDDFGPNSLSAQSSNCLTGTSQVDGGVQVGTCLNRWFDKTLQIIVCSNGSAGIVFEHSMVDGHTVLRFASDVYTDTILCFAQTIKRSVGSFMQSIPVSRDNSIDATPRKIHWQLNDDLYHSIRKAESQYSDLIARTEILGLEFGGFGKSYIVSHNLSPDAVVQLSFQLAYYRLYGELRNTYETVMTKHFLHGRTEAARPVTEEALKLVQTFHDRAKSPEDKIAALRKAVNAQVKFVRRCAQGRGAERHLFGLKCLATSNGIPLPSLFKGKAWQTLNHSVVSTSNCGNPSLRLFGFAPVVDDGFGIGYIIKDDGIQFCVSSRRRQTQRFLDTLTDVLLDMAMVLDSKLQASVGVQLGADVGMPLSTPVMRSNSGGRSSFVSGRDTRSGSARNAWGPHSHGTAGSGARWEAAHHQDVHEGHSNGGSSGSGGRGFGFRQGGGTSGSMGRGRMDSSM